MFGLVLGVYMYKHYSNVHVLLEPNALIPNNSDML